MSSFSDQTLKCRDCGADFIWTASEQEFYEQKGFANPPSRCFNCRKAKKAAMNNSRGGYNNGPRQMFDATCSQCQKACQVPFQPTGTRPILCRDCFMTSRGR